MGAEINYHVFVHSRILNYGLLLLLTFRNGIAHIRVGLNIV